MFVTLLLLGIIGGFLSGFVGVGGAVIMIPLMLTVPPTLGMEALTMKVVSGLSMVQVVFSSFSGVMKHRQNKYVSVKLLLFVGVPTAIGSGLGAAASRLMDNRILMIVFGLIAILAGLMMLIPPRKEDTSELVDPENFPFNKAIAISIGFGLGFLAGMVGAGGGFLLIPLMIYILNVPIRLTIGTSLGIVLIGAVMGALGKMATGQVDWSLALALIIASIPAAQLGSMASKKASPVVLRLSLLTLIAITNIQIWYKIFSQ